MNKKVFLLLVFSAALLGSPLWVNAQHGDVEIDMQKRTRWILHIVDSLKYTDITNAEEKPELRSWDSEGKLFQSYRINRKGFIEFPGGDWACIVLHSSEDRDNIGDVAIARNKKGQFFIHFGHNCGGIAHYEATLPELCTSSGEFFREFKSDTDSYSWEKFTPRKIR